MNLGMMIAINVEAPLQGLAGFRALPRALPWASLRLPLWGATMAPAARLFENH